MKHSINPIQFILFVTISMLTACMAPPSTVDAVQLAHQVETSVALTVSALPTSSPTITNVPLPTLTETALPTPTVASPTAIVFDEIAAPTAEPEYACAVLRRDPADDTQIRRDSQFDIEWTLVNSGTLQWEKETYLVYQSGPAMTDTKKLLLPRLKPGETYDLALRATAPSERDLQVMVWAVVSPGKDAQNWMCYPYIRIVVKK